MKKLNSITILRVLCIIGVVFLHAKMLNSYTMYGVTYTFPEVKWCSFIVLWISDVLTHSCVPLFFFISGYLFFLGAKKDFLISSLPYKLRKRVKTLLIPYLIWNLFYFIYAFLKDGADVNLNALASAFFVRQGLPQGTFYPSYTPFWFLRELIIILAFSPLLYYVFGKLNRHVGYTLILILLFCDLSGFWPLADPCYPGLSIHGWLFFCLGTCFGINNSHLFDKCSISQIILMGGGYITISFIDVYTILIKAGNYLLHELTIIMGVFAFIFIANFIAAQNTKVTLSFVRLSLSVFLIFAMHGLLQLLMFHVTVMIHKPMSQYDLLIIYFVNTFMLVEVVYIFEKILRRFFPRLHSLLTGGR